MAIPPHYARSFRNRRPIELEDNSTSEDSSANAFRTEDTAPRSQMQSTSRRASSQPGSRPLTTSNAPSSSGFHSVVQPSSGYRTDRSSLLVPEQSILERIPASEGVMMTGVINSSAPPSIMVESYYQQQDTSPHTPTLLSGGGQLIPSGFTALNQFGSGIGQRQDLPQDQTPSNSSGLLFFSLLEVHTIKPGRIDTTVPNSAIYADAIEGTDLGKLVRPYPRGQWTLPETGYYPDGGFYIKSTIQNAERQEVPLLLTIIDRGVPADRRDGFEVALVLGKDYVDALAAQTMPLDMQTPYYPWQIPSWPSNSNQTQGLQPPHLATSLSYSTTMSSSQGSSGFIASPTSLDGPYYIRRPSHRE